jgi:MFS transporter, UMF1 family
LNRKVIASWCLYDFANSFYAVLPAVLWNVYFRMGIVGGTDGRADLWWGWAVSTTMLIVAFSSPPMGAIGDLAGVRKRLLIVYTLTAVGAVCLFGTVAPGMVVWGFVLTVVSYVGFEGSQLFYNAYLPVIASPDYQGRVSGWGFAIGYVGSLLGLLGALPFMEREMYWAAWLVIAVPYLVFALPAFRYLPADEPARMSTAAAARAGIRESWRTFREILRIKQTRRFLLAYFFYEDGVNTVIITAAAFAAVTLGFETRELILLFAIVQISALAGAWIWAKPTDTLGPKKVVMAMLVQWSVVVAAAFLIRRDIELALPGGEPGEPFLLTMKLQFFFVAVLAGSGLGAIQAASRAFMSTLVPPGREGDYFGFYHLCGKSAAVMGPVLFGVISRATGGDQRQAILSVLALFVVGAVLLLRVNAGGPTVRREPELADKRY